MLTPSIGICMMPFTCCGSLIPAHSRMVGAISITWWNCARTSFVAAKPADMALLDQLNDRHGIEKELTFTQDPGGLLFAEIDGGGGPEALTLALDDARVTVYPNRDGGYLSTPIVPVQITGADFEGPSLKDVIAGDFNHNGLLDLAVAAQAKYSPMMA